MLLNRKACKAALAAAGARRVSADTWSALDGAVRALLNAVAAAANGHTVTPREVAAIDEARSLSRAAQQRRR